MSVETKDVILAWMAGQDCGISIDEGKVRSISVYKGAVENVDGRDGDLGKGLRS